MGGISRTGRGGIDMRPAWLVEQERQQAEAAAAAAAVAAAAAAAMALSVSVSVPVSVSGELRGLEKQDSAKDKAERTADQNRGQEKDEDQDEDQDQDQDEMMRMLGFSAFSTTSGQHVASNDGSARGAVSKNQQRKYRQYMNRLGGFNRKLDKI
jgi:U4/U6.U5 tri-snRNP-associated protein 3